MTERRMRITAGVSVVTELAENATADAIWAALPLEARANRWGDEIYCRVPVELDEAAA